MKGKSFDHHLARDLALTISSDSNSYNKERLLAKNYLRRYRKGTFNRAKAERGVLNLVVIPRAREYQRDFGTKIGKQERSAAARNRYREIMRWIRDPSEYGFN